MHLGSCCSYSFLLSLYLQAALSICCSVHRDICFIAILSLYFVSFPVWFFRDELHGWGFASTLQLQPRACLLAFPSLPSIIGLSPSP